MTTAILALVLAQAVDAAGAGDAPEAATDARAYDQIVVIDLRAEDVSESLARNLTEVLLGAVREEVPDASVVSQSEMAAMLEVEQTKQLMGCTDDVACWAEIGGALGAGHLITGSLGKIGSIYLVNLKLIDTGAGRVDEHASERISGSEEQLITAVTQMVRKIIHGDRVGFITVVDEGELLVDGKRVAGTPVERFAVAVGDREIQVNKPSGKKRFKRSVAISALAEVVIKGKKITGATAATTTTSTTTAFTAPSDDETEGSPWYKKWWVWTIAGTVIVGGATVAVIAATQEPDIGGQATGEFSVPGMAGPPLP